MKLRDVLIIAGTLLIFTNHALAQISPSEESLSGLYPGKAYSPYAKRSFPSRP